MRDNAPDTRLFRRSEESRPFQEEKENALGHG